MDPAALCKIIYCINQWQVGPWRRGARRHRVLMKMLRVCDAAKGSARRHLPRFERFFRLLEPTGRVERGCACERVNMHMYEARALERLLSRMWLEKCL